MGQQEFPQRKEKALSSTAVQLEQLWAPRTKEKKPVSGLFLPQKATAQPVGLVTAHQA